MRETKLHTPIPPDHQKRKPSKHRAAPGEAARAACNRPAPRSDSAADPQGKDALASPLTVFSQPLIRVEAAFLEQAESQLRMRALRNLLRAKHHEELKSLVEDQIVRNAAGHQLRARFEFNATDRMRYTIENGPTAVQIGSSDYQQRSDGSWFANRRGVPFVWPQFAYATLAERARVNDERSSKVVSFTWNGFDFKVWIDPQTARLTQYSLTDGTRTVEGAYSAFDAATTIAVP